MRGFSSGVIFFCVLFSTFGTSAAVISGTVLSMAGKPVVGANIILQSVNNSSFTKADVTYEDGKFLLNSIANGNYVLRVIAVGYAEHTSDTIRISDTDVSLPDITLQQKTKALSEVTVAAQKPLIEIKADKLVVNVENSIVNTGSSVFEVLGRSPGIMIDQSDNVSLKGRPGVTIMMDGKIMPVSGADLANMLKGMPSSAIEKIEIISNPGARYDAAGSAGIVNIISKKNKSRGLNGTATASYGQGIYHKASCGLNLNYRNKKLNINMNYNYANRIALNKLDITRKFYTDSLLKTTYTQKNQTYFPVQDYSGNIAADYNLTSKTTVGVALSGHSSRFQPIGSNVSRVDSGNTYTFFNTTNHSHDEWNTFSLNGYAKYAFDTMGRQITMDLDYARYWNQTDQLYTTQYSDANQQSFLPNYILHGVLSGITQIRSVKLDYVHPLKNKLRLDAGVKSSYVTADNKPLFYDQSGGADVLDTSKSNHFIYSEQINAAYINAAKDIGKWSMQLGLRCEQTIANGDQKITSQKFTREYTQLFPSLALQWHLNANHDVGITLSRRIDRPSYRQLNPFKYFLEPTNYRMGNPYLNPTLTYALELSHTWKQRFITTLTTSTATNVITETLEADPVYPNISRQMDKNLANMYFYGLSIAWPLNVNKWWKNTVNGNAYYAYYSGNLSNTPLQKGRTAFDMNTTSSFSLPKNYSAELVLSYQSAMMWGYYDLVPVFFANIGVQKKILKTKGSLKLTFTDVLWSNRPGATIEFNNFTEVWSSHRDSRACFLTFQYRFGKNGNTTKRHSSGAEEEKQRVGGAG